MAEWLRRWTLNLNGSACMFDSRHGRFKKKNSYDNDGGATRKARSSTCRNERSEYLRNLEAKLVECLSLDPMVWGSNT